MARRRTRMMAMLAALLVLQIPLCAFACASESPSMTTSAAASHDAPCHGAPSESEPTTPASDDEQCGCGEAAHQALLASSEKGVMGSGSAIVPSWPILLGASLRRATLQLEPPATDLPPPDILLRTSILLL